MATRIHKLNGLPVLLMNGMSFVCPEFTITGADPIFVTEKLARYIDRVRRETRYDVHVFHRGETIDSYNERNGKCFAQYAIAAQSDEPGFALVQTPQGLVKVHTRTGEGRIIK